MRLIDADVIHDLLANKLTWLMAYGNDTYVDVGDDILDVIENVPTAYDPDKVVEELEELANEHPYKVIGEPDTYSSYNEAWEVCADRAIETVKKGGVE